MNIAKIKKIKLIASSIFVLIMIVVFTLLGIDIADSFMKTVKTGDFIYLETYFEQFGFWGPMFIVLAQSLQIVLAVIPSEPIQILAGISYGPVVGFLSCWLGLIFGNFIIYVLVRKLGSNFVLLFKKKDVEQVTKVSMHLDTRKISWVVFILYLLPAIPCGLIAFLTTSTKMKFYKYMMVTTIGVIPSIIADIFLGEMIRTGNLAVTIGISSVLVILGFISVVFHQKIFAFFMKGDNNESNESNEPNESVQEQGTQA